MEVRRRNFLQLLTLGLGSTCIDGGGLMALGAQEKPQGKVDGQASGATKDAGVEKVAGIGGFFFRSQDHKALADWYEKHLGINLIPTSYEQKGWQQEAGPTAFAPFPAKTSYFGDANKQWMINFRVHNLDKMAAQLSSAGIEVKIDPQSYPNGRFAHLHDPEGNPIELWQPA